MSRVKIIATGKFPLMPKGHVYHEGKLLAELLVVIGAAVFEGQEEDPTLKVQTPQVPQPKESLPLAPTGATKKAKK